jgi:hypothetical protein
MKKIASLVACLCLIAAYAHGGSETVTAETRSPSGKLLYKSKTTGNTTEVRSPSGKLLMKSKTTGNTTEVRSPSGKLLQRIKDK